MVVLRQDQFELKQGVYDGWNRGERNQMAVLPTGGGKSVVLSDIALDNDRCGANQAIIAHRNELVSQLSGHLANRGMFHRLIAPVDVIAEITRLHREEYGRSFVNPTARAAVVGVDTLVSRAGKSDELIRWSKQVNYFTIDEGHHVLRKNKWGKAAAMFEQAFGLLVTASPCRADGAGLGRHADGIVDNMILGPGMRDLINMRALCDYEIAIPESDFYIDDSAFDANGDLSPKKGREASKRSKIVGDVVKEYCKRALFKRAICFATDVETAGEIAAQFNACGISAASVSGDSDKTYRKEMIKRFREGLLTVLVNVDLFGEGFDVPACEVVIMARPTNSLAVYLQQFGRALRTAVGKLYGLVIDHVSNWKRHGLPDKPHFWTLDRRDKRGKSEPDPDDIPMTQCKSPLCGKPYERFRPICPYCKYDPSLEPTTGVRQIDKIDGDLILLDIDTLAQMRATTALEDPFSVGRRVGHAVGGFAGANMYDKQVEKIEAQNRLRDAIDQWAGIRRARGEPDQEIYRRFYLAMGFHTIDALRADRTRAEFDKMAELVEGWR